MSQPLNPALYGRLRRAYGAVRMANDGLALIARDMPAALTWDRDAAKANVRTRLVIDQDGEYYRVNCPFCLDTRFRLYVSYMFGHKLDNVDRRLDFLAVCFNENCLGRDENRERFLDTLRALDSELGMMPVRKGRVLPEGPPVVLWPGPCKPLHLLPDGHPARSYVEGRCCDPDRLGKFYDVRYCSESIHVYARNRIVVPIYWRGQLAGWQARYLGELPWKKRKGLPPKYYTMKGMLKGRFLPNHENARCYRTGVLVEGWFDVFAFGPMALPLMGNSVTAIQARMFGDTFGKDGRSGVILLDPEEYDDPTFGRRVLDPLRSRMPDRLAVVRLPGEKDPGELDRAFLRDYVREQADDQGVEVSYERLPAPKEG
jgi:hypothetical protein